MFVIRVDVALMFLVDRLRGERSLVLRLQDRLRHGRQAVQLLGFGQDGRITRALGVVVVLVALVMIVAGCGGGSRKYPSGAVATFMESCTAQRGATERRCRCVLDHLEKTMPYSEFKRVEVEFRTRFGLSADERRKLVDAIAACS